MIHLQRALSRWLWIAVAAWAFGATFTAAPASAQLPQDEYTFSFDLRGEAYDEATVHAAIQELMQQNGATLGEKVLLFNEFYAGQAGVQLPPRPVGPIPDGRVEFVDGVLRVTLQSPPGDVGITASWWVEWLAGFAGVAVNITFRTLCVAGMVAVGGPTAALAAPTCAGLAALLGGLVPGLILNAVDGRESSRDGVIAVVGGAVAAAIGGVYWETWGKKLAQETLAPLFERMGIWIGNQVTAWASWLGDRAVQAGGAIREFLTEVGRGIVRFVDNIISSAGNNLRLMPLGDSITAGLGGSTGSSYRADLWNALSPRVLNFVGSQRGGQLPDGDHEGRPGWLIEDIAGIATGTVSTYQPNVVTLLIGTNDMVRNYRVEDAPQRLGNLINQVLDASPGTTVLVGTLTPSQDGEIQRRIEQFNPQIAGVVGNLQAQGKKVEVVSLGAVNVGDLADVVHPNDGGYGKIAQAFYGAILDAIARNWISQPNPVDPDAIWHDNPIPNPKPHDIPIPGVGGMCEDVLAGWVPRGQVARGGGAPAALTELADLNGDGRADYIVANGDGGAINAWINEGGDRPGYDGWRSLGQVAQGTGAPFSQVRFADLDGDGRADYLVMGPGGSIHLYWNNGMDIPDPSRDPGAPGWVDVGQAAAGTGHSLEQIQFADINADGLADYLVVLPDGSVLAWLNNGTDALDRVFLNGQWVPRPQGPGWLEQGKIAAGAGPGDRVRLVDINGDRKADYLVVGEGGAIDAWRNNGGDVPGGGGWSHIGQIAAGTGDSLDRVRFVDLEGDNLNDYVVINADNGALTAWTNSGGDQSRGPGWVPRGQIAGGAGPADRVRFADVNGDGRDDYLVVNANGSLHAYFNNGGDLNGDPNRPHGVGWIDYEIVAAGTGDPIEELRFADFDGDGWDDYLVLDPAQGALSVWRNEGADVVGGNGWRPLGQVALGTGNPIDHVDFADVNGDRRADYLVFGDDGSIHAWLNRGGDIPGGNGWQDIGVIATGVGEPRSRVRLAHFNCDSAVDYLVVDDNDGAVRAWVNSGSDAPVFSAVGKIAAGGGPGPRVHFADINGDGRDDYVVLSDNGALLGWLNAGGDLSIGGGGQPYL